MTYFFISHLLVQFLLLFTNILQTDLLGWAHSAAVTELAQGLPIWAQFVACLFIADLVQSVTHRWYHQNDWLWKFHAIHHSSKNMDWLAGSRSHFLEALVTRSIVILPLYIINFSETALNAYVVTVGVQAVFVHANVRWDFGFLKYVFVTPQYHHWHHSDDPEYANTNYAVHLPLVDMLMGTFKLPDKMWPDTYGVFGREPPKGYIPQLAYPFTPQSVEGDSAD
jgi:lathosterol oxidase